MSNEILIKSLQEIGNISIENNQLIVTDVNLNSYDFYNEVYEILTSSESQFINSTYDTLAMFTKLTYKIIDNLIHEITSQMQRHDVLYEIVLPNDLAMQLYRKCYNHFRSQFSNELDHYFAFNEYLNDKELRAFLRKFTKSSILVEHAKWESDQLEDDEFYYHQSTNTYFTIE